MVGSPRCCWRVSLGRRARYVRFLFLIVYRSIHAFVQCWLCSGADVVSFGRFWDSVSGIMESVAVMLADELKEVRCLPNFIVSPLPLSFTSMGISFDFFRDFLILRV